MNKERIEKYHSIKTLYKKIYKFFFVSIDRNEIYIYDDYQGLKTLFDKFKR